MPSLIDKFYAISLCLLNTVYYDAKLDGSHKSQDNYYSYKRFFSFFAWRPVIIAYKHEPSGISRDHSADVCSACTFARGAAMECMFWLHVSGGTKVEWNGVGLSCMYIAWCKQKQPVHGLTKCGQPRSNHQPLFTVLRRFNGSFFTNLWLIESMANVSLSP